MYDLTAFQACTCLAGTACRVVCRLLAGRSDNLPEQGIVSKINLIIGRFQWLLDRRVFRSTPVAESLRHFVGTLPVFA
jgi:hypothetical protein